MMKKVWVLLMAVGLISVGQAVVVDDFQSYTTGNIADVASPPWETEDTEPLGVIADAGDGNQYLTMWGWNRDWGIVIPDITTTAVVTFDVYVTNESTGLDHAFGLSDGLMSDSTANDYSEQGPIFRLTTNDVAGTVGVDIHDDGYVNDIAAMTIGEWHSIEMVVDCANGGTWDLYLDGVLIYEEALFRDDYVGTALQTFVFLSNTGDSENVRIDNLTVVPEPATLALLTLGGLLLRKRSV